MLALAKECYSMKLDLLTNAELVSNAAKFVEKHKQSDNNKTTTTIATTTDNDKESKSDWFRSVGFSYNYSFIAMTFKAIKHFRIGGYLIHFEDE